MVDLSKTHHSFLWYIVATDWRTWSNSYEVLTSLLTQDRGGSMWYFIVRVSVFAVRWQRFEYAHKRQLNPMTHIYFHGHFFAFNWNLCGKLKAKTDASRVSNRWRAQVLSKRITSTELLHWWTNLVKRVTILDVTPTKATAWKSSTSHKLNKSLSRPLFLPRDRATCKR